MQPLLGTLPSGEKVVIINIGPAFPGPRNRMEATVVNVTGTLQVVRLEDVTITGPAPADWTLESLA